MNAASTDPFKLFGYWRSSSTWRVRWALEIKKIPYVYVPVNLLKGEQRSSAHMARNPRGAVPVLELPGGVHLAESMAILEWLEETHPRQGLPLFPGSPLERARIRQLCELINAGTQPLQNLRVMQHFSDDADERHEWARHWTYEGLQAFEQISKPLRRGWSAGEVITAADLFLVPQLYNAKRFGVDLRKDFADLNAIYERALATPECHRSAPEQQPDAQN